jgi:dihydroxyacetone kinase-like protein
MTAAELVALFDALADAIEADKARLSELDGAIGDGDHGVTMSMGFSAVRKTLAAAPPADPTGVFNAAAKSFLNAVGASAGPLYATAFLRAGAAVKGQTQADLVAVIAAMARGIAERGKAQPGDKTMLDAWAPAAAAAEAARAKGAALREALAAAAQAAAEGAEATRTMPAKLGRASRLGERALGHLDPGAASAATILAVMRDFAQF